MLSQSLKWGSALWSQYQHVGRFLLVGGGVFIVDAALFYLFAAVLGWGLASARVAAFLIAVVLSWLVNRCWTFRYRVQAPMGAQVLASLVVSGTAAIANLSVFYFISQWFEGSPLGAVMAFSAGVLTGLVFNWFGANYWIFKNVVAD
ncbi:GtrA family protein [Shewanella youngdeokensis]|uniref:GtrA family protein n=1 Tax=Shewanella youngdeokensis TaxID=2999068 RepID=A0ABZ0JYL6_9GAMM|nr:GtrA family protein [Shewanella sp. DAU334]